MRSCFGEVSAYAYLRKHPHIHLSRRLLLPSGRNVKEPPPRFCPFIKLLSKSKFGGAKSPKEKTPTRPRRRRAHTKHRVSGGITETPER